MVQRGSPIPTHKRSGNEASKGAGATVLAKLKTGLSQALIAKVITVFVCVHILAHLSIIDSLHE